MFDINSLSVAPSSPADCALLLAMPLDRAGFLADLKNPAKEFVRQFQSHRPNQTADSLWRGYERLALQAAQVCDRVASHGVRVQYQASLAGLATAVATSPVVTLFAHWRSALFRADDIVSSEIAAAYLEKLGGVGVTEDNADLARRFNALLNVPDGRFDDVLPNSAGESAAKERKWYVRRCEIEAKIGWAFQGGAAIEFDEGLHPISKVLTCFPPDFVGVLDLTVCRSVLFGEAVRAKCRHCLVLSSVLETSADFRLALYAQIIDALVHSPQPFEDAVLKARRSLIERYATKDKKDRPPGRSRGVPARRH